MLIQLLAASICEQPLRYFTFGNYHQARSFNDMFLFLEKYSITDSILFNLIDKYYKEVVQPSRGVLQETLFQFIYRTYQSSTIAAVAKQGPSNNDMEAVLDPNRNISNPSVSNPKGSLYLWIWPVLGAPWTCTKFLWWLCIGRPISYFFS